MVNDAPEFWVHPANRMQSVQNAEYGGRIAGLLGILLREFNGFAEQPRSNWAFWLESVPATV
jgi:hypothetical protein